jgi:predicted HTH transcriptional regulator
LGTLLDDARPLSYETLIIPRATVSDIDEAHLWSFMRAFAGGAFDEATAKGYPTAEILERYLLLGTRVSDEVVPTVAGLLLFGKDESVARLLPRASIMATRFSGDTAQAPVIERLELHGNLATLYESALRFVLRYCDLWDTRLTRFAPEVDEAPVVARANYHRGAVSEGIANALVHRDLALRDITTRLHIFDRAIEVVNPRRSAGFAPTALKAIRFGVNERLNPQTASIFSSAGYGVKLPPDGLPTLITEARKFSNRAPEIVAFNDEYRLRVHGV